jgi:hypothetical protein
MFEDKVTRQDYDSDRRDHRDAHSRLARRVRILERLVDPKAYAKAECEMHRDEMKNPFYRS